MVSTFTCAAVAKAIAWTHGHVAKYGGDPNRIFVMGHSAGAHLAALIASDHRRLKAEGKPLSIIKGAVCLDTGGYDLPRMINYVGVSKGERRKLEIAFGASEKNWKDASPRHHVAPKKDIPPMLIFYTGRRARFETVSVEIPIASSTISNSPAKYFATRSGTAAMSTSG